MVNIWRDGQGFVYAGDIEIEHYSNELTEEDITYLRAKVEHLMKLGVSINARTVTWFSGWFENVKPGAKYLGILKYTPNVYTSEDEIAFHMGSSATHMKCLVWAKNHNKFYTIEFPREPYEVPYHVMKAHNFHMADAGQGKNLGPCYATYKQMVKLLQAYNVRDMNIGTWVTYLRSSSSGQ